MIPSEAVIKSASKKHFSGKLFGQHLIERNIRMLSRAGVKTIHLDLNKSDMDLFDKNILKHIEKLPVRIYSKKPSKIKKHISISANQFLMFKAFSSFDKNFAEKNGVFTPKKNDEQMIINTQSEFKSARKTAIETIRTGSGGKIAQNINKRISIPVSLVLARFRVSPNLITVINFFIGIAGVLMLSSGAYMHQLIGGFLFQACSVIDGCDGEVARMTTRFSKLGGLLDTLSDQIVAGAFTVMLIMKIYQYLPLQTFIPVLGASVFGLILLFGVVIFFVRRYSTSMSLAAFNREFLDVLPEKDILAKAISYLQYLTRKELYSMMAFAAAATGIITQYGLFLAAIVCIGSLAMLVLGIKYFGNYKLIKR